MENICDNNCLFFPGYLDPPAVEQQWATIPTISCISECLEPVSSTFMKIFFYDWRPGFFGRSLGRLPPSRIHSSDFLAGLVLDNLTLWPINCTIQSAISFLNAVIPAWRRTSFFVTLFCHLIFMMFLRQRCWKTSSCWMLLVVLFHVSLA